MCSGRCRDAVDGVHDLEVVGVAGDGAQQPVPPEPRLVDVPGVDQRLDGQGRVAQPAVAVVPVALAAEVLGQRGGGGRDDAAGLLVRHQAQREEGASYDVRVRHVVVAPRRPLPVVGDRREDGRVGVRRRPLVRRDPRHREGEGLAGRDVELVDVAVLVADREPRPAQDQLVRAGHGGDRLLTVDLAATYPRDDQSVVEAHHPLVPHPHRALHAGHHPHHVRPVVAGRHHVEQGHLTVGGGEGRLESGRVARRSVGSTRTRSWAPAARTRGSRPRAAPRSRPGSRSEAGTASRSSRSCRRARRCDGRR